MSTHTLRVSVLNFALITQPAECSKHTSERAVFQTVKIIASQAYTEFAKRKGGLCAHARNYADAIENPVRRWSNRRVRGPELHTATRHWV